MVAVASRLVRAPRHCPQCEGTVEDATQRWREHDHRDNRCDLPARYVVRGKNFCRRHAGDAALAILLNGHA